MKRTKRYLAAVGRPLTVALLIATFAVTPVFAQSGSTYDWRNGNQYRWYRSIDGSTTIYGSNPYTGSQWRTTIQPSGDMSGWDSNRDYWRYNSGTGLYWNSNGTTCFGRGRARTCY
jgi:hypothetical protein